VYVLQIVSITITLTFSPLCLTKFGDFVSLSSFQFLFTLVFSSIAMNRILSPGLCHFLFVLAFIQFLTLTNFIFILFKLSDLSNKFNLKEATYCAIGMCLIQLLCIILIFTFLLVAAIVGHLSFFFYKQSQTEKDSLERAAQIYQQSTCDSSIKQAVENLFECYHVNHGILNLFTLKHSKLKHSVDETLVEGAIQIAFNNQLCMV
jgi:hypothetical protein